MHLLDKFPFRGQIPLKEDLPRIPAEYAKDLFYYHEVDLLHEISEGKSWSWCEIRPDIIVCFASFLILMQDVMLKHHIGRRRPLW